MKTRSVLVIVGLAAVTATIAFAQTPRDKPTSTPPGKDAAPAGQPQLPPGWTEADAQACAEAATPGPMHAHLAEGVGVWRGKTQMWMGPGAEPASSECTSTVTPMMDGRYIKCEMSGDMPGMGPFNGFGLFAYDNVAQEFQTTWIDNCGTGIATGAGERSSDGKTMTWTYTYNCPVTKKPTTMREIERITGKDSKTLEMYGIDPKTGKEFKMMEIALTRQPGATATGTMR
jgi:hypothetical protein